MEIALLSILFRVFGVNSCFFLKVDLDNRNGQNHTLKLIKRNKEDKIIFF